MTTLTEGRWLGWGRSSVRMPLSGSEKSSMGVGVENPDMEVLL